MRTQNKTRNFSDKFGHPTEKSYNAPTSLLEFARQNQISNNQEKPKDSKEESKNSPKKH